MPVIGAIYGWYSDKFINSRYKSNLINSTIHKSISYYVIVS